MGVSQSGLTQRALAIYTDHRRLHGVAWLDMCRDSFNYFPHTGTTYLEDLGVLFRRVFP